ncbi:MAG: hypothetical protein GX878_04805 [Firmicutes bacterium]|nr:hypothetical protein [Bacillota bacterium]
MLDNVNEYIDYDDVLDAYVRAILRGESFDVHQYTSSSQAKKAIMPKKIYVVTRGDDGNLLFTEKTIDATVDILADLNGAASAGDLEALVISWGSQLGLNLADYNRLNRDKQTAVLNEVLAQRPGQGFGSLEQFKGAFNAAVAAAKPTADKGMQAVNGASSAADMKNALLEYDAVLGLGLGRFSLTAAEQDELGSRLLPLKPFASLKELQRIVYLGAVSIRSGCTVNFSRYGYTLNRMIDIQMASGSPPVTDSYGGGWQRALREDVACYIDPYNFIDMNYTGTGAASIRILAEPNLRLRERPTTGSPQLRDAGGNLMSVWQNEVYPILGQAEAEGGTEPGSEGVWYKIRVSDREGWVCGKYCQVVDGSFSVTSMFQFLLLSGSAGSTVADLDRILSGKGILNGTGAHFMQASRDNNINEIFLVSLALHETGNGTSALAKGSDFPDQDNLFPGQGTVKVYNMFGIGAYDSNPNYYGALRAYQERWFTPEAAILGGARFASASYVNHPSYSQNTLYKMRWNPNSPGTHQYATDMGWAAKQVSRIRNLYDMLDSYSLTFDIPRYQE